jgi:hypothetical protein
MDVHKLRTKPVCLAELVFSKTRRIAMFHANGSWLVYPGPLLGSKAEVYNDIASAKTRFRQLALNALEVM